MTALLLTVAVAVTIPGDAPTDWLTAWTDRVHENGGLSIELLDDRREHLARFAVPEPDPVRIAQRATPRPPAPPPQSVEGWRQLVSAYFRAEHVDQALRVLSCESRGDPGATNPTSGAAGLFQAMPRWYTGVGWDRPSPFGPFDPYDPDSNVRFASWLFYDNGASWRAWVCKP